MEIEKPNQPPLTDEDLQHLEKLQALLEKAIADGIITPQELNAIKVQIKSNGKVMIEELDLVRKFIREKAASGELVINFFG
jgi:uncharacterized membrane protein YebE (DUF533 family)